ncbi:MAG: hypothetical protein QXO51_03525 [Halobacteria archaeon]
MRLSFALPVLFLLAVAAASASHPSITPGEAVTDRKETFTLWVPVTGTLEHVELKIPKDASGRPVFHVEFVERPAGWATETKKVGDRISEIKWEAPRNTYRSGDLIALRFMAETPAAAGTHKFDVELHQTGTAEVHKEGEKEEAPSVKVVAKSSLDARLDALTSQAQQAQTQASQAQAEASRAAGSTSSPAGIAGVALGLVALVLAGVGLARRNK